MTVIEQTSNSSWKIIFFVYCTVVTVHQLLPGLVPGMTVTPITSTAAFRMALVRYLTSETQTLT